MGKIFYESLERQTSFNERRSLSALPHLHKQIEIIYVENGHAYAFAGKKSHEIREGDVFIAFPNQVHYYENCLMGGKYHVFIASADMFLEEKKFFYENKPKSNVITDTDGHLLKLIKSVYTADGTYGGIAKTSLVAKLIVEISKKLELNPNVSNEGYTLPRILSHCRQNYFNDITLDTIADELELSKYHISHLLNQRLGMGFSSYINHLRIDMACKLLRETEKKTYEIAEEVGFGSIRSFNRAFQDIMDTTPVKYKALLTTAAESSEKTTDYE